MRQCRHALEQVSEHGHETPHAASNRHGHAQARSNPAHGALHVLLTKERMFQSSARSCLPAGPQEVLQGAAGAAWGRAGAAAAGGPARADGATGAGGRGGAGTGGWVLHSSASAVVSQRTCSVVVVRCRHAKQNVLDGYKATMTTEKNDIGVWSIFQSFVNRWFRQLLGIGPATQVMLCPCYSCRLCRAAGGAVPPGRPPVARLVQTSSGSWLQLMGCGSWVAAFGGRSDRWRHC